MTFHEPLLKAQEIETSFLPTAITHVHVRTCSSLFDVRFGYETCLYHQQTFSPTI